VGGVVDEDVDPPELLHRLGDQRAAMLGARRCRPGRARLAACLLDPARRVLGILMLAQIADEDVRALAGIGDGDRAADAAVAAGDHRLLALSSRPEPL
jgi:hypothetical protein